MIVTCVICGRPVDKRETVEMPNGPTCADPCYAWLEQMMEESDGIEIRIEFEDEDE